MPKKSTITSESSTHDPIDHLNRSIGNNDNRLDQKIKGQIQPPAEQDKMGESSFSDDSDSTDDEIGIFGNIDSVNMPVFERIIDACKQDPQIILSVGETFKCLIRDINARNAFRSLNIEGGSADAARNDVPAATKQEEEAASPSRLLPKQLD